MPSFRFTLEYLAYFINAHTEYHLHSPFVFDFYTKVVQNKYAYTQLRNIKKIEKGILKDVCFKKFDRDGGNLKNAVTLSKQKKLLFNIANYFKPNITLELGTSFGIGSQCLALGNKKGELITIESCDWKAHIAQEKFQKNTISNIKSFTGEFNTSILPILEEKKTIDLVVFSNHFENELIINHFLKCLEYSNSNSVFVFENIHTSEEMRRSWNIIKQHPKVKVTIDLFSLGIVFLKKELSKQDFILRF